MKKNRKYSLILVVAVFVLSMGVFFLLYYVDNKYTARGDPSGALLSLPVSAGGRIWAGGFLVLSASCHPFTEGREYEGL